ncbi:hypothetical protein H2200_003462 [Cladophialophora chaetospira]|uniref:Uncharacterized protein n=1 Tax=Cladophialophora chaetospira TaxID=386627 RepID=A0AA39CMB0_9EURO|nr:hypothetical protein H2200_003462 [Cladophialophora chaetospira]
MSQAKWCWFRPEAAHQRRRLQDIQTLDDASRGPFGSVLALSQQTFVSVCSIGAVIVILSLAYDPFLQQLVGYPSELAETSENATILQALGLYSNNSHSRILAGVFGSNASFTQIPDCPSGNCTWPPFQSVGWCGKCDQSPLQVQSDGCDLPWQQYAESRQNLTLNCSSSLPGTEPPSIDLEVHMDGEGGGGLQMKCPNWWSLTKTKMPNAIQVDTSELSEYLEVNFEILGHKSPLLAFAYPTLAASAGNLSMPVAKWLDLQACIFTPCSRLYNLSVQNGQLEEAIIDEDYGILTGPPAGLLPASPLTPTPDYCWQPTEHANATLIYGQVGASSEGSYLDKAHRSWCTAAGYVDDFFNLLTIFNATFTYEAEYEPWSNTGDFYSASTPISYGVDSAMLSYVFAGPKSLPSLMPIILQSLTFGVTEGPNYFTAPLPGSVQAERTYVDVSWWWLILPVLLNTVGIVFLVITVLETRRLNLPLWKTSAMAMLYHGLDEDLIEPGESYGIRCKSGICQTQFPRWRRGQGSLATMKVTECKTRSPSGR